MANKLGLGARRSAPALSKKNEGGPVKVEFVLDRETKGAIRYQEVDGDGQKLEMSDEACHIGTLYLRKAAFGFAKIPERLTVTVTAE